MTLALAFLALLGAAPTSPLREAPTLGVVVVIDQFGAADLEALAGSTREDFGGLMSRKGARFDAWYDALGTETGPGHATLSTGAAPSSHGICANEWYVEGKSTYCVEDAAAPVQGLADGSGKSARFLEVPTLGDTLKVRSPKSRVVSISFKDRAAILMGGPSADVAVWYEPGAKRFTSSSAYGTTLPEWAARLADLPLRAAERAAWSPLPRVAALGLADARPGEATPDGFGQTFPHDLKALPEGKRAKAYRLTPSSMEDVFQLATAAVDGEQLGKRGNPDLLWVSISTTDYAGHTWGPASVEKVDLLERTSDALKRFTQGLDERLGPGGWVLAVTGDHGAAPLPETTAALRIPAVRVTAQALLTAAKAKLDERDAKRVLGASAPNLFLDVRGLTSADAARLAETVRQSLAQVPGVLIPPEGESLAPHSRFAGRCGPVLFDLKPYFVFNGEGYTTGTDHSSGNAYDRRVPLFLVGRGVVGGRYVTPVDARDVSASVAAMLGIPPPERAEGRPVQRLFPQPVPVP